MPHAPHGVSQLKRIGIYLLEAAVLATAVLVALLAFLAN